MNTRGIAIIGVAGVLAAIAVPAAATDLVRRSPPPLAEPLPTAPVGTTWSGFYIGGNLGAAFDPNDLSIKDLSEEQDLTLEILERHRVNRRRSGRLQLADG